MRLPDFIFRDIAGLLPDVTRHTGVGPGAITPWSTLTDPLLQKTCAASLSLQWQLHQLPSASLPPIHEHATFGFIAMDRDVAGQLANQPGFAVLAGDFTFGAAILVSRGNQEGRQRLLRMLTVAGQAFPLVEITGTVQPSGAPPNPNHVHNAGTSACWARARKTAGTWSDGIITAGHVVSAMGLGSAVALSASAHHRSPATSTLVDLGTCPIDAALLSVASTPSGLSALALLDPATTPIAPGTLMQLSGRHTSATGTVLRVNQNPGYFGPMLAERLVCDTPGVPGDSGGLVADRAVRQGLGIHIGTIPSTSGAPRDGVSQGLWQATQWFDADIWT